MAFVGMREFRSALATHIRRAQHGERVIITVDGSPVAQLSQMSADMGGATMADLIARRGDWIPDDPLLLSSGARVDRALNQVRS